MQTTPFEIPKQNCGGRRPLTAITGIIVHSTGSDNALGSVAWFKNPRSKVSAHAIAALDGEVFKALYQGHCLDQIMYHAGVSRGWAGKGCNRYTVGFEHSHIDSDKGYHDWPKLQITSAVDFINAIRPHLPNLHYIARHRDVSPGRKVDPDKLYPIEEVAERTGLVWWRP